MIKGSKNFIDVDKMNRLQFLFLIVILICLFILIKLFYLQVIKKDFYNTKAEAQHFMVSNIQPKRGEIFLDSADNTEYPLAINRTYLKLYAIPNLIEGDLLKISQDLAGILDMDIETIYYRLSKEDDIYEPIKSKLTDEEIEKISNLNYKGLDFVKETYRYYPDGMTSSHIIGFVGYQKDKLVGNYGLEGYWEEKLRGQGANFTSEKDVDGNYITIGRTDGNKEVVNGQDLYLTIDQAIQHFSCEELKKSVESYQALGGSVIVLNPNSGDILAMCNYPEFDPNNYSQVENINFYNNSSIFYAYEPGSVFKAITMAMALDLDLVAPDTTYFDTGFYEVEDYTIKNSDLEAHGEQTMIQVLDESLNTGAAWVSEKIGRERFKSYVENFGFGEKTGIELNTEIAGNISNLDRKGRVYLATISYGQGITTTPLQLVMAFSSLANGGYLYRPRIIKKIIYPNGKTEEIQPELIEKVISDKAAKQISAMLVSVVESGHASLAQVEGYYLGGKTGTAQIAQGGKYSSENTNHTFVGFGPSKDPKFVILTKLNSPQRAWAALTAAPLFAKISKFILDYYKISPER